MPTVLLKVRLHEMGLCCDVFLGFVWFARFYLLFYDRYDLSMLPLYAMTVNFDFCHWYQSKLALTRFTNHCALHRHQPIPPRVFVVIVVRLKHALPYAFQTGTDVL